MTEAIPGEALASRIENGVNAILPNLVKAEMKRLGVDGNHPYAAKLIASLYANQRERALFVCMCAEIETLQERLHHLENVGK